VIVHAASDLVNDGKKRRQALLPGGAFVSDRNDLLTCPAHAPVSGDSGLTSQPRRIFRRSSPAPPLGRWMTGKQKHAVRESSRLAGLQRMGRRSHAAQRRAPNSAGQRHGPDTTGLG